MIPGRSAFAHAIGHDADAGADFSFALSLLAQSHGSLSSGFRIASHCRCIHAYRMALFANGDGIGPVGFALASRTDGDGVQTGGFRAIAYGQCPFTVRYGIVAQGRGAHGPVCISAGADGQGILPNRTVIIVIFVAVTILRVDTEIMGAVLDKNRSLPSISSPSNTAPESCYTAQGQYGQHHFGLGCFTMMTSLHDVRLLYS